MRLSHCRCKALSPFAVKRAEAGIAVAVGMLGAMFFPQNHQRHAAALKFFVHFRPIGQRLRRPLVEARRRKQKPFQLGVADFWRDRPRDPDHLGTVHVLANGRLANAGCLAHLTYAQPQLMCQPQHLTDLPHRHSHPGHRLPLWFFTGTADLLIRMSMGAPAKRSSETVRNHRNAVRDGQESADLGAAETESPVEFATGMISAFLSAATFISVLWTIGGTLEFSIERIHFAIPGFLVIAA